MKSIDQFPIYELGAALQQFKDTSKQTNATAFDHLIAVMDADMHLSRLLKGDEFEVGFCRQTAQQLQAALSYLRKTYFEGNDGRIVAPEKPLDQWQLSNVAGRIETFEHQLSAELKKLGTYLVPERGIFNTERLVDAADNHIHESVRGDVPAFALAEFRRAGRCLAFGLHSASGFHSARAVENMTRKYYEHFLGVPKKTDIGLGLMASHLDDRLNSKQKATPCPSDKTVRQLRDFTGYDRNPLIHHAVDLSEIDAMTPFNGATAVIVEMAKEIQQTVPITAPSSIAVSLSASTP